MDRHELDSLHEQASAFYLRGEFDAALGAWKRLLSAEPDDERALEGIRLCRQMSDGVADPQEPLMAIGDGAEEPDAGRALHESLEEIDRVLDGMGPPSPAGEAPTVAATDGGGGSFLDLSDLADSEAPADAAPGVAMWEWDSEDRGEAAAVAVSPRKAAAREAEPVAPAPRTRDESADENGPAAVELRRRVNELLASALAAVESGRYQDALGVAERILILDEDHALAVSLREKIRESIESGGGIAPDVSELMDSVTAAGASAESDAVAGAEQTEWVEDDADLPVLELDTSGIEPPVAEEPETTEPAEQEAAPRPAARRGEVAPAPKIPPRPLWQTRWFRLAAGAAAVVLVTLVGWVFLGSSAVESPAREAAESAPAAGAVSAGSPVEEAAADPGDEAEVTGTEAEVAPAPPATPGPAVLAARARKAFDERDYAAAVKACDAALELSPDDREMQALLLEAGELYREEREAHAQRDAALAAFDRGEYQEALRGFYRLPEGDTPEVLGYKLNGWYNLGVQALRSGNCTDAISHLSEARALAPRSRDIVDAMRLARACTAERGSTAFALATERLPLRRLSD